MELEEYSEMNRLLSIVNREEGTMCVNGRSLKWLNLLFLNAEQSTKSVKTSDYSR